MLRRMVLLSSLGALLLGCHTNPGPIRRGPYLYPAGTLIDGSSRPLEAPYIGPIAGMTYSQAVDIFTRHRSDLLRVPGVENVALREPGVVVQTTQPSRLPPDVEGLPVLDLRAAELMVYGWPVYFPLTAGGTSEAPATAPLCPAFPADRSPAGVALQVAKASDRSGVVCVRAVNRQQEGVGCGMMPFRLQQKEESTWREVVFPNEPQIAVGAGAYMFQPGERLDGHLPGFGRLASPGLYRACFRFWPAGQSEAEERCSPEVSLP